MFFECILKHLIFSWLCWGLLFQTTYFLGALLLLNYPFLLMIPFGERNECSKVVFSLMVLRIIMHFWCASSLLCLLSPCLSKVVQWFNVFRYRIPYWCTKPPSFMTIIKRFCLLPTCKASLPETILSAFMDIMLLDDFFGYLFWTDFRTDFLGTDFCGTDFRGTDFRGTDFRDQIFGDRLIFRDKFSDKFLTYISKLF